MKSIVITLFNIIALERELMTSNTIHSGVTCHDIPKEFVGKIYPMLNKKYNKFSIITSGSHCTIKIKL